MRKTGFQVKAGTHPRPPCRSVAGLVLRHPVLCVWGLLSQWRRPESGRSDRPEALCVCLCHPRFTAYLEEIQSVRRHTNSASEPKSPNPPLLVHCSAGVGRTGVVVLSEIMIACLEHNEVPAPLWARGEGGRAQRDPHPPRRGEGGRKRPGTEGPPHPRGERGPETGPGT